MESRVFPPVDGSVTLPETLDFHVEHNTYASLYVFAQDGKADATHISFLEFGRAADRVAHHVRPARSGPDGQVVAFVALSDTLLYQAMTMGILRAGLIPYPMSPRNTGAAIVKLMKDTSCHRLITTQETLQSLVDDIKSELTPSEPNYALVIEEVPPLGEIFPNMGQETLNDPFVPYPKGHRLPLDNVMMYLHSSGSTGLPKTIPQTFRTMVHWASLPAVVDNKRAGLKMGGMALPPFHTLGIIVQLLCGLYSMQPVGLYPPIATTSKMLPMSPTPGNILDHLIRSGCNGLMIIPALLQIWGQDKTAVNILANLEYVGFSGGSMPSRLGNLMTDAGVYITPVYGATEFGAPSRFFRRQGDEKEWEYVEFPASDNIRWDPQGDGTFELQFLSSGKHQMSIENLSDVRGYATSDIWVPHPTKPYLWKIVGRKDDVIVHTSGEKTVPAPMEDILMSSPYIMGTVMFGRERNQAGVLIELKPSYAIDPRDEDALVATRNALWPIVEEANKVAPAFSRIFKEMILITSPNKPLPRAGKGTVMRKAALSEYAEEIDDIYAEVDDTVESEGIAPLSSWDFDSTLAWLQEQVEDIHSGDSFSVSEDLFAQGIDSLSATILRRRIVSAMTSEKTLKAAQLISQTTIYAHPTIEELAAFLAGVVADPESFVHVSNRADAIDAMIGKYSVGLAEPIALTSTSVGAEDSAVVLLTGSTGNLGAQILESLLRDPKVGKVYTLDRPSSGSKSVKRRQEERFADKALDEALLRSPKLVTLECEASHRNLGLDSVVYDELRNRVTTIIHNAWKLDFNQSLSSFEPNVQTTRNLIDFARSSACTASLKFLFTSSVSSAHSWDKSRGLYPEEVVMESRYAVGNGYGESKYVAERILAQSGLKATSIRIGQITGGAPNGAWATSDWVPSMVKSSIKIGAFPASIGVTSWLPMDAVSQAILDLVWSDSHDERAPPSALNLVHPRPVSWDSIMSSINDAAVDEGVVPFSLPVVNFKAWFGLLEKAAQACSGGSEEPTLRDIPAIKLLEFFRGVAHVDERLRTERVGHHESGEPKTESGGLTSFAMEKMVSISRTVDRLPLLGKEDAVMWVRYWRGVGFI